VNGHRVQWYELRTCIFLLAAAGCAIKQIPPTTPALSAVVRGERIVQLPTRVIFESVDTGRELTSAPPEAAERAVQLDLGLNTRLVAKGLHVVTPADLPSEVRPGIADVVGQIGPRYVRLIGASRDKSSFLPSLAELGKLSGADLACVPVFYAKVGKGGGYDPNSGAIWTTTSSTSIRVGLVSLATGERVWFREAFMRSVAQRRDLDRAIDVLFREE
jgi:hypothetical protein